VEKRSSTSTTWTKVITLDAHQLHYTIDNLKEKCEYWFRVSAENEVGLGAPAVTESISLKTHASTFKRVVPLDNSQTDFGPYLAVPSPPTAPLEARVLAANAHIFEWGIPESDGGAPLLGYHIAIRDMKKTMWIEVGRVPAGVQKFQIRDLQENHEYMIRIFAKNEIGLSEPLESEEPYKVMTAGECRLVGYIFELSFSVLGNGKGVLQKCIQVCICVLKYATANLELTPFPLHTFRQYIKEIRILELLALSIAPFHSQKTYYRCGCNCESG